MLIPALPAILIRQEDHVFTSARGTLNAVRPATADYVIMTVLGIGEIENRFLGAAGLFDGFHASSVPGNSRLVNYIMAQISAMPGMRWPTGADEEGESQSSLPEALGEVNDHGCHLRKSSERTNPSAPLLSGAAAKPNSMAGAGFCAPQVYSN